MTTRSVHEAWQAPSAPKQPSEPSTASEPAAASTQPAAPARLDQPRAPQVKIVPPALPKGGGAIKGLGEKFEINEATGAASLSIPFPVTPCRGAEPQLHLSYGSGGGNGPFGLGFALSLPEISRRTSKEIPRYGEDDVFLFSGEALVRDLEKPDRTEDLLGLPYTVRAFRPRIESGFDRIERWQGAASGDTFWKVVSRDNVTSLFGRTLQARVADPGDPSRIFRWLLEETFDAHGHRVQYLYKAEDGQNVPPSLAEENRETSAQKYLSRVRYGNARPVFGALPPPEDLPWHFEIVLDYGEHAIDPRKVDNYTPVRAWACRQDPFSFYDAGFEVRTYRLCRNILMFHRFPELGPLPVLVRALSFQYEESPVLTRLRRVLLTGFQSEPDEAVPYASRSLPPLDFGYTPFLPSGHDYETFLESDDRSLPGVALPSLYSLVDLYGQGIPGVLYCDGSSLRYWAAEETPAPGRSARYAAGREVPSFPIDRQVEGGTHALVDLTGDGQLDLLVTDPPRIGYYSCRPDGSWKDFRPLDSFPLEYHDAFNRQVDVTGDGLADLVRVEATQVRVHPALRGKGFAEPELQAREATLPILRPDWPRESVRFADLAGAGKPQLVRIADGEVTYWPSLGYGRFGPPVRMMNAPRFGPDFDTARVFLADLDGSGAADLIHASADWVDIYFNQSGNGFSETPLRLPLPERWDDLGQIQFADVLGNGTTCLVFARPHPVPRHWYYDFCQRRKPYLLERIDNNMGAVTTLRHASSTEQYLEDKRAGQPWITRLPFPVHVVDRIEHRDLISHTRHTSSYRYRHGFYDGEERDFAGFGRVDRLDTEEIETLGPTPGASQSEAPWPSPPTLTRTWYHTGAWWPGQDLLDAYRREYFNKDAQARPLLPPAFDFGLEPPDPETRREAHRALHGAVVRTEVYGLDGSPWSDHPYVVTETTTRVRLLQERAGNPYAVFSARALETLQYDYERNPADPRVTHEVVLKTDEYEHVLRSCLIAYGRRKDGPGQQKSTRIVCQETEHIHELSASCHLLGVFLQTKRTELPELAPDEGLYFGLENLRRQVEQALPSGSLRSWERAYYYDPETQKELMLGRITAEALPSRTEHAELDREKLVHTFAGVLTDSQLADLLLRADSTGGGYRAYPDDPAPAARRYLWNPGSTQSYLDAGRFFLPYLVTDPFGSTIRSEYDPHDLLVRKMTDALDNETTVARIDYQTLAARQIEDANGNVSEVLFDPLGLVTVSSFHGTEGGRPVGFEPLSHYQRQPAPPSSEDVLNDPRKYLQGAASFFQTDLDAWVREGVPVHVVHLVAETYPAAEAGEIQIHLLYSDGFGRELQSRLKVREPGPALSWQGEGGITEVEAAERWLTSGAVRYNQAGHPIQTFEPFFADTPHYIDSPELNQQGVSSTLHYDALGRQVLVVTPKTFLIRTLYGEQEAGFVPSAWSELHFDENRTVRDSDYFAKVTGGALSVSRFEKESLEKAALFHGAPVRTVLDNLGRTIRVEQRLIPAESELLIGTYTDLDIDGRALALADTRLHALGRKNLETVYTMTGQTLETVSVDAGTRWHLRDALGKPIFQCDSRGFKTSTHYDELRRPIAVHVQGGDGEPGLDQILERLLYGDSKGCFAEPERWNLRGQLVAHLDSAGLAVSSHFSLRGEPLAMARVLAVNFKEEARWDSIDAAARQQLAAALEAVPHPSELRSLTIPGVFNGFLETEIFVAQTAYDALGRVREETDPDGNVTRRQYHSTGWLESARVLSSRHSVTPSLDRITYDAKGQRISALYGNGVEIAYSYERETFRLARLTATRPSGSSLREVIQDLEYFYDPAGNVTHITDHAIPSIFCNGQRVDPESDYTYDSLDRLIRATGREHPGMWEKDPQQLSLGIPLSSLSQTTLSDQQKLQNYTQTFSYDAGGNLLRIKHQASQSSACWTRVNTIAAGSNRLLRSELGGCEALPSSVHDYPYDANGNQKKLDNLSELRWSSRDHLQSVTLVSHEDGTVDGEYYVYSNTGQRARKITERFRYDGAVIYSTETIYLGSFEIHREKTTTQEYPEQITTEWHSFSLMDTNTRASIWRYPVTVPKGVEGPEIRYQLQDHLNSSILELDDQSLPVAYEQYFPYGGTALADEGVDAGRRKYRYSGKERDDTSFLYYYGARYYCTWLGRWLNPDPVAAKDGINLYGFVHSSPITLLDPEGYTSRQSNAGKAPLPQEKHRLNSEIVNNFDDLKEKIKGIVQTAKVGDFKDKKITNLEKYNVSFLVPEELYKEVQAAKWGEKNKGKNSGTFAKGKPAGHSNDIFKAATSDFLDEIEKVTGKLEKEVGFFKDDKKQKMNMEFKWQSQIRNRVVGRSFPKHTFALNVHLYPHKTDQPAPSVDEGEKSVNATQNIKGEADGRADQLARVSSGAAGRKWGTGAVLFLAVVISVLAALFLRRYLTRT